MLGQLAEIIKKMIQGFIESYEEEPSSTTIQKRREDIKMGERNDLISVIKQKHIEKNAPWEEVNFFGIRYDPIQTEKDTFNDFIGVATDKECYLFDGTTKPGWHYIKNGNKGGAANLCVGYHRNIWQVDIHGRGKAAEHMALCQLGNKVTVWRDVDKTGKYNPETSIKMEGWYGINLHRASINNSTLIGLWGAGCQVVANAKEFGKLLDVTLNSEKYKQNKKAKFSYMLFDNSEIRL